MVHKAEENTKVSHLISGLRSGGRELEKLRFNCSFRKGGLGAFLCAVFVKERLSKFSA
jgi:hypothetical protein